MPENWWDEFTGIGEDIGAITGGLSNLLGLGTTIAGLVQGPSGAPVSMAYQPWLDAMPDRLKLLRGALPMPQFGGQVIPELWDYPKELSRIYGGMTPATSSLYENILGRQYGMSPEELEAKRQSILASQSVGGLGGAVTPGAVMQQSAYSPQQASQYLGQNYLTALQDQQSLLKNAARLAAYNTQTAKNVFGIVG